ncbi:MAG TPA: TldD/PmbA family protein [Thermoplasmata archaeon]|nr:TldD/PmbA family protein [Thermoplasmata archaeon]
MSKACATETAVLHVLDEVVASARRQKVAEFDAYAICTRTRRVTIERELVSSADSIMATGLHVRVCVDGKVGGASCNEFDRRATSECIDHAVRIANLMESDKNWSGFPSSSKKYPSVSGLYDTSVASLDVPVMSMMAEEMIDGARSVSKDVSAPYGAVESTGRTVGVTNSSGMRSVMSETELQALICCVAGSGESISPDCEESGQSRSCDLRIDKIGERAGWIAEKSTHILDAKTEECDVVFSPMSLGAGNDGLLNVVLSEAFSGQNTHQGISFLAGRLGEPIWSEHVTINDNPLLSGRCGSRPFDDEGIAAQKTRLVNKGTLVGYVWDSYHGSISGEGSTGNAIRDLSSGTVGAAPLCLQVMPDRGSMKSLIESVDHGYLVWGCQGSHTSNTETGGFSFVASPGLLIKNGEVVGGVRGSMVSGNVTDLMKNVERVGADVVDFGSALMPSILFRNVKITTG